MFLNILDLLEQQRPITVSFELQMQTDNFFFTIVKWIVRSYQQT